MHIKRTGLYLKRLFRSIWPDVDAPVLRPLPNPLAVLLKMAHGLDYGKRADKEIQRTRENYRIDLARIRRKCNSGCRIRVMFIATCAAKWKVQSLYDVLESDAMFDPCVGVSCIYRYDGKTPRELFEDAVKLRIYLERKGCKCQYLCDPIKRKFHDIPSDVDIVIYTESWYTEKKHHPVVVAKKALTCYIPYYVPNYVDAQLECGAFIHRCFWRYITLNEGITDVYRTALADKVTAGEFVSLGHPMLDMLYLSKVSSVAGTQKTIIYAPHWTFVHPRHETQISISTFTQSGWPILEYARSHRQYRWVFKPHPNLRQDLIATGMMTRKEVEAYFEAWRELGQIYEDGDYFPLFLESSAMITDCGSFLSEYGACGKPIIHLISHLNKLVPPPILADVYNTYYKAHNLDEMFSQFKLVIENGQDPMKEERLAALSRARLCNTYSAASILNYFKGCFE